MLVDAVCCAGRCECGAGNKENEGLRYFGGWGRGREREPEPLGPEGGSITCGYGACCARRWAAAEGIFPATGLLVRLVFPGGWKVAFLARLKADGFFGSSGIMGGPAPSARRDFATDDGLSMTHAIVGTKLGDQVAARPSGRTCGF